MTTLQEAARDALEALERIGKDFVCRSAHHAKKDQHSAFAECPVVVRHTDAIESLRTALAQQDESAQIRYLKSELAHALAQQGERKNCPQPEICGSKECEFCRDTAAPAQKPVAYITQTEQGPMVWTPEMYDEACTYCDDGEFPIPLYTVALRPTSGDYAQGYAEGFNDACKPAPQAQDKSDNYLSGYCTGRTDLLKEQSAQPVAQPLTLEQILDIVKKLDETPDMSHVDVLKTFARAIEAAHGIGGKQ